GDTEGGVTPGDTAARTLEGVEVAVRLGAERVGGGDVDDLVVVRLVGCERDSRTGVGAEGPGLCRRGCGTGDAAAGIEAAVEVRGERELAGDDVAGLDAATDLCARPTELDLRITGDPDVAVQGRGPHRRGDIRRLACACDGHDGAVRQSLGDVSIRQRDEGIGVGGTCGSESEGNGDRRAHAGHLKAAAKAADDAGLHVFYSRGRVSRAARSGGVTVSAWVSLG